MKIQVRALPLLLCASLLAGACGSATDSMAGTGTLPAPETDSSASPEAADPNALRVLTHDSFNLTTQLLDDFAFLTGISVEIVRAGDAGAVLNQAILTKDNPLADAIFGIDNISLGRALEEGILLPHPTELPEDIEPETLLDPSGHAVPIDRGDVCLNYDREVIADADAPTSLDELRDPAFASQLVVQDPSTSSPGLAFLLATVAAFGEDGWQPFWSDLRDGGVTIASGWEDAYYGEFSGGSGEGDNALVVSYASSPPAEIVFGPDPDADEAPTGVVLESCFRQVEFAGTLAGTDRAEDAQAFVDFLLSDAVQSDIPLQMYVFPVRPVDLPEVFVKHAQIPAEPWALDPDVIEANREAWVADWVDLMLR